MTYSYAPKPVAPVLTAVLVLAWLCLLVLYYAVLISFGGWLGSADVFMPWSLVALALWSGTRRMLALPAMRSRGLTGVLLFVWLGLLVLAALGIDEGRIWSVALPSVGVVAAVLYSILPVAVVGAALVVLAVCTLRKPHAPV